VLAYAKREKILERELAKVNASIKWVPGPGAFSANADAMNTGAINSAGGAISPIVGALAHGLRFRIYAISEPAVTRQSGIIVPAQSPIKTVKDLIGKRVAVNLAAHGDYILLKALANEGVPGAAVERVNIQPPEAAAAFATGKIDAWSTFGVFYNSAVRSGARIIITEAEIGSDDVGVESAHESVLNRSPGAFLRYHEVVNELVDVAHRDPDKFQNVFTDKGPTALSGDELRLAVEGIRSAPKWHLPTEKDRARITAVAKLLYENRSIDRLISADEIIFDVAAAERRRGIETK
jgi:sulfonate transport system substrate-binding protein